MAEEHIHVRQGWTVHLELKMDSLLRYET